VFSPGVVRGGNGGCGCEDWVGGSRCLGAGAGVSGYRVLIAL